VAAHQPLVTQLLLTKRSLRIFQDLGAAKNWPLQQWGSIAQTNRDAIETRNSATMQQRACRVAPGVSYSMLLTVSIVLMVVALGLGGRGVWLLLRPPR